jgi:hypothetical protein
MDGGDSSYNNMLAETCRCLRLLLERYSTMPGEVTNLDQDEVKEPSLNCGES